MSTLVPTATYIAECGLWRFRKEGRKRNRQSIANAPLPPPGFEKLTKS